MTKTTAPEATEPNTVDASVLFKFVGILFFVFGSLVVFATHKDVIQDLEKNPEVILRRLWKQDLEKISLDKKLLPKEWLQIKEIQFTALSPEAEVFIKDPELPLPKNPKGKFHLDVQVDKFMEDSESGLMVLYKLVDVSNGDTVFELGRTFIAK